jgi:hypothetical protein
MLQHELIHPVKNESALGDCTRSYNILYRCTLANLFAGVFISPLQQSPEMYTHVPGSLICRVSRQAATTKKTTTYDCCLQQIQICVAVPVEKVIALRTNTVPV